MKMDNSSLLQANERTMPPLVAGVVEGTTAIIALLILAYLIFDLMPESFRKRFIRVLSGVFGLFMGHGSVINSAARFLLAFVLCLLAASSWATTTPADIWHRDSSANAQCATVGASPVPLISNASPSIVHSLYLTYYNSSCNPAYTYAVLSCSGQTGTGTSSGAYSCVYRGTNVSPPYDTHDLSATGSQVHIECSAGKVLNAYGACVVGTAGSCPASGTLFSEGYYSMGSSPTGAFPAYVCAPNSCGVSFSGSAPAGQSIVSGATTYYAKGNFAYVGGDPDPACTLSAPDDFGSIPAPTCGSGQQMGTVNGQVICLDTTTGTPAQQTTQTTDSATSAPVSNPDGSTTVTNTTTNPDGSVTTSTTTTNTDGSATTTNVTTQGGNGGGLPSMSPIGAAAGNPSNKRDENPTCGWPGGPACKIDETGTPDGSGAYDGANSDLDAASNGRESQLSNLSGGGKVTSLPGFSFDSWLPTAGTACTSFNFTYGEFTREIDWCPTLERLRALWGWVVGLLGAFYVWRRATSPMAS